MDKRWWRPLRYGIVAGTIIGVVGGLRQVLPSGGLEYHLYNTSLRTMVRTLDVSLVSAIVSIYVLTMVWSIAGALKGSSRKWCRASMAAVFLGYICWTSGLVHALGNPRARAIACSILAEMNSQLLLFLGQTKWRLLAAIACLVLGIVALKRVHKSQPSDSKQRQRLGLLGILGFLGGHNGPAMLLFAAVLSLNAVAGYFAVNSAAKARSKPNIILVMFDTSRADHIGCYGYPLDTSPNVDKFAEGAIRFDRAFSQATITSSSVGSYMTSRYPQSIYVESTTYPGIPKRLPTLAEVLKDQGYSTNAVTSNILTQRSLGFAQGFDYFNESPKFKEVSSPSVLDLGLKRIEKVKNKPFFMFLLFMDPHTPYIKHDEFNFDPKYKGKLGDRVEILSEESMAAASKFTPADIEYMRSLYDGETKFTDEHFGQLIDALKREGLYDNSIIILLGDHGEEFMEHDRLLHGHTVYEEVTRVPLIVKLPKQTKGAVVDTAFPLIDLLPSLMKYLDLDPSTIKPHGSAVDFDDLDSIPDDDIFSAQDTAFGKLWAIRHSGYKLIWNTTTDETMLFDLRKDPGEHRNIAQSEPSVLSYLLDAVKTKDAQVGWKACEAGKSTGVSPQILSDQEREKLRSLGYLQ